MAPLAPPEPARIAVLASGGGSNLDAIVTHLDAGGRHRAGDVVLVVSDRADAGALAKAAARSIATSRLADPADGESLDRMLREAAVDLVVLAGYLRLVPPVVTRRFRGRLINVHPALLPAFGGPGMYGRRAHRAVLDAGVTISGVTAHFVDDVYDRGPIIAQWPVPVAPDDTPESLAARVLRVEHILYPRVVAAVAAGRVTLDAEGRVHGVRGAAADGMFALVADPSAATSSIDHLLGSP